VHVIYGLVVLSLSACIQFKSRPLTLSTSFEVYNLNELQLCGEGGKGKDEHWYCLSAIFESKITKFMLILIMS
jgi:hypothetical protein